MTLTQSGGARGQWAMAAEETTTGHKEKGVSITLANVTNEDKKFAKTVARPDKETLPWPHVGWPRVRAE